VILCNCH